MTDQVQRFDHKLCTKQLIVQGRVESTLALIALVAPLPMFPLMPLSTNKVGRSLIAKE